MNSTNTINHKAPAASNSNHNQPKTYLPIVCLLLRHLNARTLALLLFVGFAFLNTTDGKEAQTIKPTAEATNTQLSVNDCQGASADAAVILWQFTARFVSALIAELSAPSFGESETQHGTATLDLQTTPCPGTKGKTSTY